MRTATLVRAGVLAISAAGCAALSGLAALYVLIQSLPPSDEAYGMSVLEFLGDPFVRVLWVPFTFGPAFIGFMASLWALWRVRLTRALPLILIMTVAAAAIAARANIVLAVPVALVVSLATMDWCHSRTSWALRDSPHTLTEIEGFSRRV